ncbi:MAG: hypothetical protein ACREER_05455 [Alphaproteobacteria bacterium]
MAIGLAPDPAIVLAELLRPVTAGALTGGTLTANPSALAVGAQLLATVVGKDAAGRTLVRTEAGPIALARRVDAPRGSVLTLEIHEVGGRLVVGVRSISPPKAAQPIATAPVSANPGGTALRSPPVAAATPVAQSPHGVFAVVEEIAAPAIRFPGWPRPAPSRTEGVVAGHDRQGRTLVRIDQGVLVLAAALGLEDGTPVVVTAPPEVGPRVVQVEPAPRPVDSPETTAPVAYPASAAPRPSVAGTTVPPATVHATVDALIEPGVAVRNPPFVAWLTPGTYLVAVVGHPDDQGRSSVIGPWGTLRLAGPAAALPGSFVTVEVLDVGAGLFVHLEPMTEFDGTQPVVRHGGAVAPAPPSRQGAPATLAASQPAGVPGTAAWAADAIRPAPATVDDVIDIGRWTDAILASPSGGTATNVTAGAERAVIDIALMLAGVLATSERQVPDDIAQAIVRALPRPGPGLAAELAHLAAVVTTTPDTAGWLGDDIARRLDTSGHAETRTRLDHELERLVWASPEPAGRVLILPLLGPWGPIVAGLFVGGDGAAAAADDAAYRFVVDLDLARSGRIQIDGLVRGARLDLVVRTPAALPPALGTELAQTFHRSCGEGGLDGAIRFAVAEEWPIAVRALGRREPLRSLEV